MGNRLKELLSKKTAVAVPEINRIFSPRIVEVLARLGYGCVWLDQEHSDISYESMSDVLVACEAKGLDAIVRIAYTGYTSVMKPLELGAKGLVFPHCLNAQGAQDFVRMAKFHPQGLRGMGAGRDTCYGTVDIGKFIKRANDDTLLVVMIEDREAIEDIDGIASVEGIDVLFVGPGDLSQSLGIPGEMRHKMILEALDVVAAACEKHGKSWGLPVVPGQDMRQMLEKGATFLCCANDMGALFKGYGDAYAEAVKNIAEYGKG